MPETNARIKVCHDTAANFKTNNPTLLVGEWALETDTKKMKIGDGSTAYNALPYSTAEDSDEWRKPDDWQDITSGAIYNSIYALVGHSSDYGTADNFGFTLTLTDTAGSFNVYIDNVLYNTYASGANVTWKWSTLALTTGSTTITPASFVTHVVRITPVDADNKIASIAIKKVATGDSTERQGWLWVHFAIDYAIASVKFANYNRCLAYYLTAITALSDNLHISGNTIGDLFGASSDRYVTCNYFLAKCPTLEVDTITNASGAFNTYGPIRKIKIKVNGEFNLVGTGTFVRGNLEELDINKPIIFNRAGAANRMFLDSNLKKIPSFRITDRVTSLPSFIVANTNLKDTVLDFSEGVSLQALDVNGNATHVMDGLKGMYVSNRAPFDSATAPQLNVSYTGLSRAALVNLFKSMPYNKGYTVTGSPTITDGILSGIGSGNSCTIPGYTSLDYNTVEMFFKIKYPDATSSAFIPVCGFGASNSSRRIIGNATAGHIVRDADGTAVSISNDDFDFITAARQGYYLKLIVTKNSDSDFSYQLSLSLDKSTWVTATGSYASNICRAAFYLLQNSIGSASGNPEMDLNETYIKLDGVPYFTGKASMTKTVSVVGCTGTADLTADDKAVAEDKGWAITLS